MCTLAHLAVVEMLGAGSNKDPSWAPNKGLLIKWAPNQAGPHRIPTQNDPMLALSRSNMRNQYLSGSVDNNHVCIYDMVASISLHKDLSADGDCGQFFRQVADGSFQVARGSV